jgi:hypothetical protein
MLWCALRRVLLENNLLVEGSVDSTEAGQRNPRHRILSSLSGQGKQVGSDKCQKILFHLIIFIGPLLWSSGQSSWLQIQRSWVLFLRLPDILRSSGSGAGSTQPHEYN